MHRTVNGIPENEAAAVRTGIKSVVLFRLAPRLDNTPVTSAEAINGGSFPSFLQANIDRREPPRPIPSFSPSAEAAAGRWIYYLIPPGKYWAGFLDVRMNIANSPRNNFFLEVPEGVPLLYAGTLSFGCKSRWVIFGREPGLCGDVSIEDESEAADTVARRDLGEFGPMATVLLRPMPWMHGPGESGDLAPMGVMLNGSRPFSTPGWKTRGIGRATGLESDTVTSLLSGTGSPVGSMSSVEAHIYLGYALYLPLGLVAGLVGGEHSARKWGPCMDNIAENVINRSPGDALRTELVAALARHEMDNVAVVDNVSSVVAEDGQPRFRSLFEIDVQEVAFRECGERWTFCAEMKVRGQLRDVAKGRIHYDGTLIYSNYSRRFSFTKPGDTRPYERVVYGDAPCRPIEKYCAPDGAKLFVGDLEAGIQLLAERLVEETAISPGRGERHQTSGSPNAPSLPMTSIPGIAP